jgi:hypothetical protein
VVFQYIQPLVKEGSFYEQVRDKGSGVHNLTFVVKDMNETMRATEAAGASDLFTFPLDWGKLIGPDKVKPDVPPVHMVNIMEKIGFHLELSQRPSDAEMDFLSID